MRNIQSFARPLPLQLSLLAMTTLMSCRNIEKSETSDVITINPGDRQPSLGAPYDSLAQFMKDAPPCVEGKAVKITAGSSDVSLKQSANKSSTVKEYTGEVKGTPRVLFAQSQAALGIFRSSEQTKSSTEILYTAKILQEMEKLDQVKLITDAPKEGPEILTRCGDEYVGQINRGGLLTIHLNLDFGSEQNRQKYQSLLNLSVPLREFNSDIKKKSESNQLQGMLSIAVHQLGGMPNQALLTAKTCAMSNPTELAECTKLVDSLIDYASNSFPSQVESNPAVLGYTTVPLSNLGVGSPVSLDPKVLEIRKSLEQNLQLYTSWTEKLKFAESKGLTQDQGLESAIDFNISLTKALGQACYQYKLGPAGPSFEDCIARFKAYPAQLKPVAAKSALVQQLEVSAQDQVGPLIVNQSNAKMSVVYTVDPMSRWNFGVRESVGLNSTVSCNNSCAAPSIPKGALLVQSASGTEKVKSGQGTLEIYPGEAAYFFMNDEMTRYNDNHGGMTVLWRCLDCLDATPSRSLAKLIVPAREEMGVTFVHRGLKAAKYQLTAYGRWTNSVGKYPWSDGRGYQNACGKSCPMPQANNQLLVAQKQDGSSTSVGIRQKIELDAGESLTLKSNDDAGGYGDNGGELVVYLQCLDCEP